MSLARITLIGTEKYLNHNDKSITDKWLLPEIETGSYDKNVLLSAVITKGGQFEPLFSDPDYFYDMCEYWWEKWHRTFFKWFDVFDKDYEPLWDRNGYEEIHDDTYEVLDNDTSYESSRETREDLDDDTTSNSTTENQVSAYDSSTYQPKEKTTINSTGTDDRLTVTTDDAHGSGTNDSVNDRDYDRSYHSWGNWGISQTSQKLLKSELDIQAWNIYNHIADIFCKEMLIRVY